MKKRIVLCADDYGQAPSISQAIIHLLRRERLSAVSCLVTMPDWQQHAGELLPYFEQVDIGLHFNLTEGALLTSDLEAGYSLSTLIQRSLLRQLNRGQIAAELHAQIDRFVDAFGFQPQFIDGHQHVHQFPVVRDAVLEVYESRFLTRKPYVRLVSFPLSQLNQLKRVVVQSLGANTFRQALLSKGIPHNTSFSGMYSFDQTNIGLKFRQFLRDIEDGGLIMCHPGFGSEAGDAIAEARAQEFGYLDSDDYLIDCQGAECLMGRFTC